MDHGDHAPSLLHESLQDVLGPAILPPLPLPPAGGGKAGGSPLPAPAATTTAEDEARLRRLGQEWTIPPEEIAKRCVDV